MTLRSVDSAVCTSDMRHHEQRPGVQKIFLQDVTSLKATIDEYINPFLQTSGDLLVLDTRDIVEKSVIDNLYRIETLGCQQYDHCVSERLVERTIPIYDVMKKNKIQLFNTPHKRQKTKTNELVSSLKSDRNLFSRLYVHRSFVMVSSMNVSLTRTNHVLRHCQLEGNSNWAPSRTLFDASKMP